ncbi:TPA: TIGR04255 family protein [Burkholderia vietnamiensis]|uniref:TIGR04255 family protein n=1 Tax=Burkholderia vietnamiensis TaxID=60552 RepID=UPI001B9F93B3|nr:TIGR04255 family protein [Burkholderia vietnamiensis]MBR7976984.1 TIGR04255 family protein [Burkholderia vietnamiensis]HDR9054746.1 TIGR04255 family protein [Burkholderia vietnamiensis]
MLKNMTRPTVLPVRGNHSVKNVVFVCEFASNLTSADLEKILAQYQGDSDLKSLLPVKVEQRGAISITFQAGVVGQHSPVQQESNDLVGLAFNRMAPDGGLDWGLNIQPNAVLVSCHRYDRWAPAAETAIPLLQRILGLAPHVGIATMALQYTDEWTIASAETVPIGPLLFRPNNGYIAERLMAQAGAWHCHTGWFEPSGEALPRNLANVNVNVNAQPVTNQSTVMLNHAQRAFQVEPIFLQVDETAARGKLEAQFLAMHVKNKQLLKDVLVEAVQEQIKLFATS